MAPIVNYLVAITIYRYASSFKCVEGQPWCPEQADADQHHGRSGYFPRAIRSPNARVGGDPVEMLGRRA
jgi:hypothetical protein